jgi:hypothetical protein
MLFPMNSFCSLAPLLRGEGRGEGRTRNICDGAGFNEAASHPDCCAIRPLPVRTGRGEKQGALRIRCRPRAGGDPYALPSRFSRVRQTRCGSCRAISDDFGERWLWVPAFARTTLQAATGGKPSTGHPREGGDPYSLSHRLEGDDGATLSITTLFGGYGSPPARGRPLKTSWCSRSPDGAQRNPGLSCSQHDEVYSDRGRVRTSITLHAYARPGLRFAPSGLRLLGPRFAETTILTSTMSNQWCVPSDSVFFATLRA